MLRKAIHIAFAFLLLASTLGISFSMHYCGGMLKSASIIFAAKSCCDDNGGCCRNETFKLVEVEDDFVNSATLELNKVAELKVIYALNYLLNYHFLPNAEHLHTAYADVSPLPLIRTQLSLLQTFRC